MNYEVAIPVQETIYYPLPWGQNNPTRAFKSKE